MVEHVLVSVITFLVGLTLGGAVATIKGITPVKEAVGRLETSVAVMRSEFMSVAERVESLEATRLDNLRGGRT